MLTKIYFKKDTLARVEHFWILLLTLDGRRFVIWSKFKHILNMIQWSTKSLLIKEFNKKDIEELIDDLIEKWIIIYSSEKINSELKIVENSFVSEDCLSFPRTVYREVTQLCNLECIHCYSDSKIKWFKWLDFDIAKKLINELVDKWVEFLNIWWWEPLMYKYIYDVIKYASSKWLMIEITTNWTLINKESINKLKGVWIKFIQISLDWSNKEIYEKIRKKANFEKVIESIKLLIQNWFIVSVNTVLMKYNKDDIINIIELCKKIWVNYFKVAPLMETWRWWVNDIQLKLSKYKRIYTEILKYKGNNVSQKMKIIIYQNILQPEVKNIKWMPDDHFWCPAWRTTCWIDSFWNVYPCSYMNHKELICGNISHQTLWDIWTNSEVMKTLRNIDQIKWACSSCKFINLCRWWCRAMSYLRYKKLDESDPLCVVNL